MNITINDHDNPKGRVAEVAASATGIVDRVKQLEGGVEQGRCVFLLFVVVVVVVFLVVIILLIALVII